MIQSRNWRTLTAATAIAALALPWMLASARSAPPENQAPETSAPPTTATSEPAAAPATSGSAEDEMNGMLRGPDVPDAAVHTLVRLDAQGRFIRIEGRPEDAAVSLLNLDADARENTRQAAATRRESLRTFIIENLDLVIAASDAQDSGDGDKARNTLRQMRDRFDPAHERDPLLKPMAAVLTVEQQQQLAALVDEYWTACIDWELRNAKDKSPEARQKVQDRMTFEFFQQDYRSAYDRTLRPYRAKFDSIVLATQPTPEQKEAIRHIIQDYIRAGRLEPSPDQQREAARQIYQALDDERRMKLFEAAFNRL